MRLHGEAQRTKGAIYRVRFDVSQKTRAPMQVYGSPTYDVPIDRDALTRVISEGGRKRPSALLKIDSAMEQSGVFTSTYYYIQHGRYRGGRRYSRCGLQVVTRVVRPKIMIRECRIWI